MSPQHTKQINNLILDFFSVDNRKFERYALEIYKHLERHSVRSDYFMVSPDTKDLSSLIVGVPTLFTAYFILATPQTTNSVLKQASVYWDEHTYFDVREKSLPHRRISLACIWKFSIEYSWHFGTYIRYWISIPVCLFTSTLRVIPRPQWCQRKFWHWTVKYSPSVHLEIWTETLFRSQSPRSMSRVLESGKTMSMACGQVGS